MGRSIPTHVRELQKNMDWENPEWRNKFWALMAATVLPLLQHLDEAGRMSEATPKKKVKVGQAIKKVLELVEGLRKVEYDACCGVRQQADGSRPGAARR
jgi:hypothetical protein